MEQLLFRLLVMAGAIWLISSFYWLRVLAVLTLLAIWGGAVAAAPVYLSLRSLSQGSVFAAILPVAACALPAFLWWMAAKMAYHWALREEQRYGGFWKRWNAR